MQEIWKDIPGYEGLYQASNKGNIKSLFRYKKLLKLNNDIYGYKYVILYKNKISKNIKVHRLVALTFIENTYDYKVINHINGIKTDNRIENLEWCTTSHNIKESYRLGLSKTTSNHHYIKNHPNKGKIGILNHNSKKVNQYDKQGNFIKTWDSLRDIERKLNIKIQNISLVCQGKVKTAGGFIWKFNK